uniref:Uncharacterized protein n=1 Tax=Oryza barthii TaxID=65489 RepID=A0A0D3EYY6_9ORYZ
MEEEEEEAANKILQVQIMPGDSEDRLYWKHSRTGDCNTKSAYKEFMKRDNPITHQLTTQTPGYQLTFKKSGTPPPLNARNRRRTRKTSPPNRPAKLRRRTLRNRRRACKISPEAARFSIKNWKSLLYHGETRSRTLTGGDRQADEEY